MKNQIRKINKMKRLALTSEQAAEKSLKASSYFLESDIYKNAMQIMLYMPIGNEIDTSCIIEKALKDDKKVILPVTDEASGRITPCYIDKNTKYRVGAFSVKEPLEKEVADISKVDVIVVPGIAFDKNGVRVGFGKGCYDMLLRNNFAIKVGFCYDFQIYDKIVAEEHDIPMNFLVSETGIIKIL